MAKIWSMLAISWLAVSFSSTGVAREDMTGNESFEAVYQSVFAGEQPGRLTLTITEGAGGVEVAVRGEGPGYTVDLDATVPTTAVQRDGDFLTIEKVGAVFYHRFNGGRSYAGWNIDRIVVDSGAAPAIEFHIIVEGSALPYMLLRTPMVL